jgi:hypothetical protein
MRLSAQRPAQGLLAASRDPGAIKMSTRPGDLDDSDAALSGGMREGCYKGGNVRSLQPEPVQGDSGVTA